jgi:SAM-dependent methyltransferase
MQRVEGHNTVVRAGYELVAERYLAARDRSRNLRHLEHFVSELEPGSRILDVGCGAGEPVDSFLTDHGCNVIGIDISPKQIELARKNVRGGLFEIRDMQDLAEGQFAVDGVVSFYAIFHTPRESHAETLKKLASFLPQGGRLLVTMGAGAWEGEEEFYGEPMRWSHFGAERNRQLVEAAGFEVLSDEIEDEGGERHQIILGARVQAARGLDGLFATGLIHHGERVLSLGGRVIGDELATLDGPWPACSAVRAPGSRR